MLLDAPCSALGLRPSLRVGGGSAWSASKSRMVDGKALVQHALYQRLMLRQAVKALKPGGRLVFSTCTLNPDENEGNTAWALQELGLLLIDLRSDALLAGLGAPGVVGGGARGGQCGLSAQDCAKVMRFNPGEPCAVVPIPGEANGAGAAGRAVEVDLCPGFYMACFEKPGIFEPPN